MPSEHQRRMIGVPSELHERVTQLRDEIAETSGLNITLADAIRRAVECLEDAHQRGAWLSPREAEPILNQRHVDGLASVLAQFIAHYMPDHTLKGIVVNKERRTIAVVFDDDDNPRPLLYPPLGSISN